MPRFGVRHCHGVERGAADVATRHPWKPNAIPTRSRRFTLSRMAPPFGFPALSWSAHV